MVSLGEQFQQAVQQQRQQQQQQANSQRAENVDGVGVPVARLLAPPFCRSTCTLTLN
ncbi:hypothetical protein T4C_9135 [Trichinella pseudospiralis]|uniref:Uncharacterized protein n=1 Tax=Trichinella pseudospiralis TaxID=6337 RepID=A0A0V1F894_TRIPS|nr:hypothetical protein T4D_186 [Trichinella pseudospiralis]KRZ36281.1 hypothetical protein T4C_9135 [Trichinella pseudospiralis]